MCGGGEQAVVGVKDDRRKLGPKVLKQTARVDTALHAAELVHKLDVDPFFEVRTVCVEPLEAVLEYGRAADAHSYRRLRPFRLAPRPLLLRERLE